MKLKLHRLTLPLNHPFTIARGSMTQQESVVVELEYAGISGWGEVTENSYYGHSCESIIASLSQVEPLLEQYLDGSPESHWETMRVELNNDLFALSALDMAAHDLHARRLQQPLWKTWGLEIDRIPPSSFTIGIDRIEMMVEKLNQQPGWPIYKIKLGTDRDIEVMTELRQHTDARFRVDANCGWTAEQAVINSKVLAELGVEFIEQPLPADASEDQKRMVFELSALPIIADESCQVSADVETCRSFFHGINVKICKCGGLTPAKSMLQQARQWGMKTMVGCMVESSIGISAAAQLLPLLDYADLDGAILLSKDPASGVVIDKGHVHLSQQAGTSAKLR